MKLFSELMFLSAASTNERMADDEMPCASGLLRGRSAPRQRELLRATHAMTERVFMLVTSGRIGKDFMLVTSGHRHAWSLLRSQPLGWGNVDDHTAFSGSCQRPWAMHFRVHDCPSVCARGQWSGLSRADGPTGTCRTHRTRIPPADSA